MDRTSRAPSNRMVSRGSHTNRPPGATVSATVVAAELMGWGDRVGSIEPGTYADLVATIGDIVEDVEPLTSVGFVMKGGEVVKGA